MNKLFTLILIAVFFISCEDDSIKRTYTVKGVIGSEVWPVIINDNLIIKLISDDQVIAVSNNREFHFDNLKEGENYSIVPEMNLPGRDGLTTLDMVKIDNYLLGTHPLDPFQKLAADVNMDNQITLEDKELIRLCIVGGRCVASWRFVSPDYDGAGNGFVDQYIIQNLFSDHEINFLPLKVGDVNNTINP